MRSLQQAAELAGISYRQAWHWQDRGYIDVQHEDAHGMPTEGGSGTRTMLTAEQERQLRWTAELVRAGFKVDKAAELAKQLSEGGSVVLSSELVLCHAPMLAHAEELLGEERA